MTESAQVAAGSSIRYRRAEPEDIRPAFAIFRRSITASLFKSGIVDSPTLSPESFDASWAVRGPWIQHLWDSCAENWLAVDADGRQVGWAMSVLRGDILGLCFFFVDPDAQSKGIGRELLARALPEGVGRHRSIIATQDPRAMSRYLRAGTRFITSIVDFENPPRPVTVETDLVFTRLEPNDEAVDLIGSVDEVLMGGRRDIDIRFLLGQRPAWIARRNGKVVGFAFGDRGDELTGPIAALEPDDIPALLAHVENEAHAAGRSNIYFSTPLDNHAAVTWLLGRGFTLDPFVVQFLADDHWLKTDRWIHTGLSYIL